MILMIYLVHELPPTKREVISVKGRLKCTFVIVLPGVNNPFHYDLSKKTIFHLELPIFFRTL